MYLNTFRKSSRTSHGCFFLQELLKTAIKFWGVLHHGCMIALVCKAQRSMRQQGIEFVAH